MANTSEGQAGVILSPEALLEFERFFLGWLDRSQAELETGGSGDLRELATLCAVWCSGQKIVSAPVITTEFVAALAASAKMAGTPELVPGIYPRAHPVEVFGRGGGLDIAFVFDAKWHRLPDSAYKHAATEVARRAGASISAEDYASGAAFFLTALRNYGWVVLPPTAPTLHMPSQDK